MAPNSTQQGVAATYGSLSLPPNAAKKTAGWKLYVVAGAFAAIALVGLFMTIGGQTSRQSVASTEDDIRILQAARDGKDTRPDSYQTSDHATPGEGWDGQDNAIQPGWTKPVEWAKHDNYDGATEFGGDWIVHHNTWGAGNTLTKSGEIPDAADHSWRTGYKWASAVSELGTDGWGPCYPACGYSVQFREVVCIRSDHTVVDGSRCNGNRMPDVIQQCFNYSDCHPCWKVDGWGDCKRDAAGGTEGSVDSTKTRSVSCSMCELDAGVDPDPKKKDTPIVGHPWNIPSPLNSIGFRSWEYTDAQRGGMLGGRYRVSTTTFHDLVQDNTGLEDKDVCVYGGVGICDYKRYDDFCGCNSKGKCGCKENPQKLEVNSYFCGFDYEVDADAKGLRTAATKVGGGGCTQRESMRRGYICDKRADPDKCPNGGLYNENNKMRYKGLRKRQMGFNCNVRPVQWSELALDTSSHKYRFTSKARKYRGRFSKGGYNRPKNADDRTAQYSNLMYWELGPFEAVADASNHNGKGTAWKTKGKRAPLPLSTRDVLMKDERLLSKKGWRQNTALPNFRALVPKTVDRCINFCELKYEWSVFETGPTKFPRQFACMNGTYVRDGEVKTGCMKMETKSGKETLRPPDILQQHNTHMFCGVGINVKPHRCCRMVMYGTCENNAGGCYSDGSIHYKENHVDTLTEMKASVTGYDHSKVHPHSYCALTKQSPTNNIVSRLETMVNVPFVRRYRCENRKKVYECNSRPNSNVNWPNEEPCVRPLRIVDGEVVHTELPVECKDSYATGGARAFEKDWLKGARGAAADRGLPRRRKYVMCTNENCAWGKDGAISSDKSGKGPQMDTSGSAPATAGFHQVVMLEWVKAYGDSCIKSMPGASASNNPSEGAGFSNYNCLEDNLADTCEEVPCFENCTSTWVCNGWGSCREESMERILNRTQEGYCEPRFFEFLPVDGPIIKEKKADGSQSTCSPTALETIESQREECEAGCDLISFQCRQCWCMRFLTNWKENRWTASQEYNAVMDATGRSCYNAYIGRGTVMPSILRQCRGHACPGVWAADRCFETTECNAECAQTRKFRKVHCSNRYTHMKEPESLCISNPVGSDWEMILSMSAEGPSSFWYGAHKYWEGPHLLKANCKSVRENRKLHAFNSKKFDQMKVCFGFGFTLDNADFEEVQRSARDGAVQAKHHVKNMAEFTRRTGWTSSDEASKSVKESNKMLSIYLSDPRDAKTAAPSGSYYIGVANMFLENRIKGLRRGLKTTIRFKARSCTDAEEGFPNLASLSVQLNNDRKTTWSVSKIPDGHWSTYEFSFVPPVAQTSSNIRFSASNKVLLDEILVLSDGFKLVGYEEQSLPRSQGLILSTFNVNPVLDTKGSAGSGDVYGGRGYRANLVGQKGPGPAGEKHWDEMLIVAGGSDHDILDFTNPGLTWYQFKPRKDPYTLAVNTKATVFPVGDFKTSDMSLQNAVTEEGGAVMCVASADAATFSSWSLNGAKQKSIIEEGAGDAGGCYHRVVKKVKAGEKAPPPKPPRGVYYAPTRGLTPFITQYSKLRPISNRAQTYPSPALRIFTRSASMHGSDEEVHTNCIKYDFREHVWKDAMALFSSGEIQVGNSDFEAFSEIAFEQAYGVRQAGKKCESIKYRKSGFNLNIKNWGCTKTHMTMTTASGAKTFVRMGFLVDPHHEVGAECENAPVLDGAIGLGLFGHDAKRGGAQKLNSGFSAEYPKLPKGAKREWQKKNSWVWVADTSQNPAVEGILTFDKRNHNKQGYIVLDGAANVFEVPDQCKQKCKMLKDCKVGFFVKEAPGSNEQKGQCWLASKFANTTEVAKSDVCDPEKGWKCDAFEKKALLQFVDSNAYIYTEHMVLPGYDEWDLNKQFATGTVFEIHETDDKFSPIILGPLTVSKVISKQFSYGKQTYVYWQEDFKNFDTMRSKVVFTHKRASDSLEMYGMPGKVIGCSFYHPSHTSGSSGYNDNEKTPPRSGRTAEAMCNELNKRSDACHGFSCWKNPNLVPNGGFEETESEEEEASGADDGMPGWEVETSIAGDKAHFDSMIIDTQTNMNEKIRGPMPFVCEECLRYVHLVPGRTIRTTVNTMIGIDYIVSFFYSGKICAGGNPMCNTIKKAIVYFDFVTKNFCRQEYDTKRKSRYTGNCDMRSGRHSKEIAVNVEGWGGFLDVYKAADPTTAPKPYRWKHVLYEVQARYKVSQLIFKDQNPTGQGKSGIILDEVNVQVAHPGHLGDKPYDNFDHQECATYCDPNQQNTYATKKGQKGWGTDGSQGNKDIDGESKMFLGTRKQGSQCDFTVQAVQEESVEFKNSKVDKDWFAETVCMNMDGSRMEAVLCEKRSHGYPGVLLSTKTGGGRQHYYSNDQSLKSVFGGVSKVVSSFPASQGGCPKCAQDEYGPWRRQGPTYFATAPAITVFTYKLQFTNGVTSILNIEVKGANFAGSIFKLLSRAKTVLSLREVNYIVQADNKVKNGASVVTYVEDNSKLPAQNFAMECPDKGMCTVVVPGSPIYEDTVFYFEEASNTYEATQKSKLRRRDAFCIRTPVCELFGNQHFATYDFKRHTSYTAANDRKFSGEDATRTSTCSDGRGIRDHLDCTDVDFFTNFEASKCTKVQASKAGTIYGIQRASANGAFRLSIKPNVAFTSAASKTGTVTTTCFRFGLYEYVQSHGMDITDHERVELDAQRAKDRTLDLDDNLKIGETTEDDECSNKALIEPSYAIEVCRDVVTKTQTVKLFNELGVGDKKATPLAEETPTVNIPLEETVQGGGTKAHYFWADMYHEAYEGGSRSFVRFGMDMPSTKAENPAIKDVTIGGDVLLKYQIPKGKKVLKISHSSVESDHPAEFEVCSVAYRHGRTASDRHCLDKGHCACAWHFRKRWDEIRCDENCGYGRKRRLVYCRMEEHVSGTTDCALNYGDDCIYFIKSNPHCKIQFYEKSVDVRPSFMKSLIPIGRHPRRHAMLQYNVRGGSSSLYPSGSKGTSARRAHRKPGQTKTIRLTRLRAVSLEGQGCSVLFSDNADPEQGNVVMRIEVPPGKDKVVLGQFTGSAMSGMVRKFRQKNPGSCRDKEVGFDQSCYCETGCSVTTALQGDKALAAYENSHHTLFLHKADLNELPLKSFYAAKYNQKSCDKTKPPPREIECKEKHGCCLTCAYGDFACGDENCKSGNDLSEQDCNPPALWDWNSIQVLKQKYRKVPPKPTGGCGIMGSRSCASVQTRRITCEEQKWECTQWSAETDKSLLDGYYIPRALIEHWLDKTEMYQHTLKGPEKFSKIVQSNSKGRLTPICKQKRLVLAAGQDKDQVKMRKRFNSESDVPGPYLFSDVCGKRGPGTGTQIYTSKVDQCLAKYAVPLNVYQYAEGCPETCSPKHWGKLKKGVPNSLIGKVWHINEVPVRRYTVARDVIYERKDYQNAVCGADIEGTAFKVGDVCNVAQMKGTLNSRWVQRNCQNTRSVRGSESTLRSQYNKVHCSFDKFTEQRQAFSSRPKGKFCRMAKTVDAGMNSPKRVCVQENRCGPTKYCHCRWRKNPNFNPTKGCGDVLNYREPGTKERDPDGDGVWCEQYDNGPKGNHRDNNLINCPLSVLEKHSCCCGPWNGGPGNGHNFAYAGCCANDRPLGVIHAVDFTLCSYQWHVRVNTNGCDNFVSCVPLEAWKADERYKLTPKPSLGEKDPMRQWCVAGPQHTTTHDNFVTYGLGGCWLPDAKKSNPMIVTANQEGNRFGQCLCYFGGTDFVGNSVLNARQTPFSTASSGDGYCTPIQVEGPSKLHAIHVAVGILGRTTSATIKGALYTDGGSVAGSPTNAARGQPGHRVAITRERTISGNNRQWAELRFPMGIGAGRRTAPLFSMKNKGGAVDIVGGRYWLCVFTKGQTYLHKINKDGVHMDGTPNDDTVKMRRAKMSYSANTNAFPPVFMKSSTEHAAGGSFSIYANIKSLNLPVYRDATHGECSEATSCGECTTRGDQGTGLPCDWANGKCMTRRQLEDAGVTSANSCSKNNPWASELYMQLGSTWNCKTKGKTKTLSQLLHRWTSKKPAWKPSSTVCAEACYFANMDWAGWTGVYGLGMLPSDKYPASISTGHKYPLEPTPYPLAPALVAPFFCEGFKYVADTSCTFLSTDTLDSIQKTGGSEQCYISKDNPNPCALGASDDRKWVKSGDGKYYFVVDNEGLLEYVEVGPHGPAKCGTSKKMGVFQTPGWIGKSASGVPMPNPRETCSDATCARCLDHMLGRSMTRGMLRYDAHSQANGNCKLVTASRVKTTCDGEDMRMTCANGEKIIVEVAKYGRQEDSNRCAFATGPLASKIVPTNANKQLYKQCWEDVTSNVELHCQGKSDCKVRPSKQYASGVCRKLYSYLKVEYSCTTPTGVSI